MTLSIAVAGCGAGSRKDSAGTQSASPMAQELPCGKLPAEANCPGPAPPKPAALSPDGPVTSYESDYLSSDVIISENGVYGIAATQPGTFALTGTVVDARPDRPPFDPPAVGATVRFSSVSGRGLPLPPGGAVSVATKTGSDGEFAFIDIPAARSGSCYRMTVDAPEIGRYDSVDLEVPEVSFTSIELNGGVEHGQPLLPVRGTGARAILAKACAARASR